jgi:hypothetical protein
VTAPRVVNVQCPTCGDLVARIFEDEHGAPCFEHVRDRERWGELRTDGPLPSCDWTHCYCRRSVCVDFTIDNAEAIARLRRARPGRRPMYWTPTIHHPHATG